RREGGEGGPARFAESFRRRTNHPCEGGDMLTHGARPVVAGTLLVIALVLSVGCAHGVVVAPKPPEKAVAEKVPADVGLYLSKEVRSYRISEVKKGDKWNYDNLGEASASQLRLGLSRIFRTVELVDERPPFTKPQLRTFHVVIEPAIEKFDFDIPFTKFQVYPAKIIYKVTVYDIGGTVVLTKTVEGI